VALFLGNHPDFLAAYLGTHLASGVTVTVNKGYQRAELRHIFEDSEVRLCVTEGEGWFRTDDLGCVDEDGYFAISGRKKELIITGGYNVYPREVEEMLEGCPEVAEVAVVGLPDPEFVDALPRNALGKVLKHEVREKLTEGER
jgi:acyl-CoA synthetase (AMP-forming)/AMP-acid ligase II